MNSHNVTLAGFLAFAGAAGSLQVLSARPASRVPSIDRLLRQAMRTRTGRVGVTVGWAWIGLHFFAR